MGIHPCGWVYSVYVRVRMHCMCVCVYAHKQAPKIRARGKGEEKKKGGGASVQDPVGPYENTQSRKPVRRKCQCMRMCVCVFLHAQTEGEPKKGKAE